MSITGKPGSKRYLNQEMHSISRRLRAEFDIIEFSEGAQSEVGGNVFVFLGKTSYAWKMFKHHVFVIKYGDMMGYIAKVTSKSMVTIPAKIMRKYGIKEGMRVKFIESETGILMIPIPKLEDLRGMDRQHAALIIEGIKELEAEHREEARE